MIECDLSNKPKDLLELNPYGKVPVLVDGDGVIYESAIINEYLEETYPGVPLLPKNPLQRARVFGSITAIPVCSWQPVTSLTIMKLTNRRKNYAVIWRH